MSLSQGHGAGGGGGERGSRGGWVGTLSRARWLPQRSEAARGRALGICRSSAAVGDRGLLPEGADRRRQVRRFPSASSICTHSQPLRAFSWLRFVSAPVEVLTNFLRVPIASCLALVSVGWFSLAGSHRLLSVANVMLNACKSTVGCVYNYRITNFLPLLCRCVVGVGSILCCVSVVAQFYVCVGVSRWFPNVNAPYSHGLGAPKYGLV